MASPSYSNSQLQASLEVVIRGLQLMPKLYRTLIAAGDASINQPLLASLDVLSKAMTLGDKAEFSKSQKKHFEEGKEEEGRIKPKKDKLRVPNVQDTESQALQLERTLADIANASLFQIMLMIRGYPHPIVGPTMTHSTLWSEVTEVERLSRWIHSHPVDKSTSRPIDSSLKSLSDELGSSSRSVAMPNDTAMLATKYFILDRRSIIGFLESVDHESSARSERALYMVVRDANGRHCWKVRRGLPRTKVANTETTDWRSMDKLQAVEKMPSADALDNIPPADKTPEPTASTKALESSHHFDVLPRKYSHEFLEFTKEEAMYNPATPTFENHLGVSGIASKVESQIAFDMDVGADVDARIATKMEPRTAHDRLRQLKESDHSSGEMFLEFDYGRLLLSQSGFLSPECRRRLIPISSQANLSSFQLELKTLDSLPERECFSVAVLHFSNPSDTLEEALFGNGSRKHLPDTYVQFLTQLGWSIDLAEHSGWRGGYRRLFEQFFSQTDTPTSSLGALDLLSSDEISVPYWADNDLEVIFHVPYVCKSIDVQLESPMTIAKSLLSDDLVYIVWLDVMDPEYETVPATIHKALNEKLMYLSSKEKSTDDLLETSPIITGGMVFLMIHPLADAPGLYWVRILTHGTALADHMTVL